MEREPTRSTLILTQALQSVAVAVAIVFLGHFMIWMVAQAVMMPDATGDTPPHFEDQADAP
jgi:hypothetical protein